MTNKIIFLILAAILSACTQRSNDVAPPDVAASAPDATGKGLGGGGRR